MSEELIKLASLALGSLGFLLGLYNLARQSKLAREGRELAFTQMRNLALVAVTDAEATYIAAKRSLSDLRVQAASRGLSESIVEIDNEIERYGRLVEHIDRARNALEEIRSTRVDHQQHLRLIEDVMPTLTLAAHVKLETERLSLITGPIVRTIEAQRPASTAGDA